MFFSSNFANLENMGNLEKVFVIKCWERKVSGTAGWVDFTDVILVDWFSCLSNSIVIIR